MSNCPAGAVIFDVDGTLIDSVDLHAQAWADAFRDFGYDFSYADIRAQIGKGGDQLLPVFLSQDDIALKGGELEQHRGKVLKEVYLPNFAVFPGVRLLVQRLVGDGVTVVLASSAKADELQNYAKIAKIDDLIDMLISSEDAEHSKPHPDIFESALKRLNSVAVGKVVVIGDTPYDAEAARKANLKAIGVRSGGWSEMDLRGSGCMQVYDDPADLLANYDSWSVEVTI